jgi:octaprenyl-diphosphate synthase
MQHTPTLAGGEAKRRRPGGLRSGATRSHIDGPRDALGLVADELRACEARLHEVVGSDVAAVPEVARYLLSAGGKRLRPALTALGARVTGHGDAVLSLMAAGELIHLGSLLHDDVVDDAAVRRGKPAARVVYGNAVSVLTGDFCVAQALLLASEASPEAARELARTVAEMSAGEVLQLQRAGTFELDLAGYLDVIDRKSASLIAWCCSASARGADPAMAEALATYGRKVGLAFQITDDVLDYVGNTGKLAGADLRERKATLPLFFAMEADPAIRSQLEQGPPADEDLEALIAAVTATGALQRALDTANRYVEEALDALQTLPAGDARRAMEVLARFLVERTT